ncbi:TetR/AcrR family transcriptional regulator [Nocardioides piscis]|uniref:TetR/AcrR family transcriptional regulator n=1 Tax=Nocardioides piscis TaxID=2714938 RepID=A0A6G7YE00_9ACTN|nr:TetR family transcriptional regulator [Nocardioides piscis]QIK74871.1 TetR/AcrR family transcriptional regulator [Nocardioides piscis]
MPPSLRDRLVAAAVEMTTSQGWAKVTMAGLAAEVGVSRQTVYNEIGTKSALAEAMTLAELARFLDLVVAAFDQHPTDLPAGIETAICAVLEHAQDNPLLHAVVSATHGADTELLPLLVTNASPLLEVSKALLTDRVAAFDPPLTPGQLEAAIDMVVRVVLSHVMQPSGTPAQTAADIAFIAGRVLAV